MSTPAYGPMAGFIKKYKDLPSRAANAVEHPINTLESLLGINQPKPAPAPDPYMLHNDPDIEAANASYRNRAAVPTPTTPARTAARKKYPGMMSGGQ